MESVFLDLAELALRASAGGSVYRGNVHIGPGVQLHYMKGKKTSH